MFRESVSQSCDSDFWGLVLGEPKEVGDWNQLVLLGCATSPGMTWKRQPANNEVLSSPLLLSSSFSYLLRILFVEFITKSADTEETKLAESQFQHQTPEFRRVEMDLGDKRSTASPPLFPSIPCYGEGVSGSLNEWESPIQLRGHALPLFSFLGLWCPRGGKPWQPHRWVNTWWRSNKI